MVCAGEGCSITFEDCTFDACALIVIQGAHVDAMRPQFQDMNTCMQGLSVFVDGADSQLATVSYTHLTLPTTPYV